MQPVRLRGGKMRQRIWASGDVNAVWPKLTNAESTGGKRQKDTVSRKLLRQQMKYAFQMKSSDWKQMALEYTQNSSLHGLRYMGSTDLHFTERLFWIVSFLLAVITAAYFITNLVTKWNEMPVIVSLSPTSTPLTSIPFPAVTVCNMNNVRKSVAEEILKGYDSIMIIELNDQISSDELNVNERKLLSDFCDEESPLKDEIFQDNRTGDWEFVKKFMIKVSQPCHEMMVSCLWHGESYNCYELFNPSLTDEGMCCSFNRVKANYIFRNLHEISDLNVTLPHPSVDWTPETGYPPGTPVHFLPWRPWGAGTHLGLTIVMDSELDEYYCSSEASTGFKIVLHNPVETPKIATFGTFISPGEQTQYVIQPIINIATQSIEGVAEDKRQCVFSNERRLRFYRTYTQHNCILECEANFTLSFCECVMYYMPKDRFSRICGKRDLECANRAKLAMEMRLSDSLTNITKIVNGTNRPKCGCLPGCYGLSYTKTQSASLLSGKLKIKPELLGNKDPQYFERNIAVLHLFFQDTQFTGFMKGELFGFTEFLSNTGGLLGLFMGFSFLSAFEAFYFLSLRLWCTVIRKRKIESELLETEQADKKFKHMFPFPFLR